MNADKKENEWSVIMWRQLGHSEVEPGLGYYVQITGDVDFPDKIESSKGEPDCPSRRELEEWIHLANRLVPGMKPVLYVTLDPPYAAQDLKDRYRKECDFGVHGKEHVKMNLLPEETLREHLEYCRKFSPFFRAPWLSLDKPMMDIVAEYFNHDSSFVSVMMQPFDPYPNARFDEPGYRFHEYPITSPTDSSFRPKYAGRDVTPEEAADVYWKIIKTRKLVNKPCYFLWHPNKFTIEMMKILIERGI
jgi:hypothetical protein